MGNRKKLRRPRKPVATYHERRAAKAAMLEAIMQTTILLVPNELRDHEYLAGVHYRINHIKQFLHHDRTLSP